MHPITQFDDSQYLFDENDELIPSRAITFWRNLTKKGPTKVTDFTKTANLAKLSDPTKFRGEGFDDIWRVTSMECNELVRRAQLTEATD